MPGVSYLDSLAGLVFFLLCGRIFQQKTFERLAFDRDYRSFFRCRSGDGRVKASKAWRCANSAWGTGLTCATGK